jgi:membrane peptidoglycan carboxypeptidase
MSLIKKCDRYIHLLAREDFISKELQTAMLAAPLTFRQDLPSLSAHDSVDRKVADSIRIHLLSLLDIDQLYTVDRIDMSVKSTIDLATQVAITQEIIRLQDPDWITEKRLKGLRTLAQGDPSQVIYSFVLYEKTPAGNLLRVQTDNYNQPFNVNQGLKLNLGSTAKLRTLIHYLEIIASLYEKYNSMTPEELRRIKMAPEDKLRQWARSYLLKSDKKPLIAMLRAAMDRKYSASPYEGFFTGGGLHRFENFNKKDNYREMSIREGFRRSVNLVFIRLMRDIAHYHMFGTSLASQVLRDRNHPQRKEYLKKFADFEGTEYLKRFYTTYRNDSSDQIWKRLIRSVRPIPQRLAAVYRYIFSERDLSAFRKFLQNQIPDNNWHESKIIKLYRKYGPNKLSLKDRSYIARIHPLELWLAAYLHKHPARSLEDALKESYAVRQDTYHWLFRTSIKRKQDRRIRIMLEQEAFVAIHKAWQRLGYPFNRLVASYATAIGSSADRPQALAELMGIIANNGVHRPAYCIQEIKFAINTPYEVHFARSPLQGQRVLKTAVAQVVKQALFNVVAKGTAKSVYRAFLSPDETAIPIGGKTGTGDDQYKVYDSNGKLISAKTINRSATFVFIIGDRFFGNITAYVPGPSAADYTFTSSLPVAILKIVSNRLMPLLTSEESYVSSTPDEYQQSIIQSQPNPANEKQQPN